MDVQTAQRAMVEGLRVRGTDKFGHTYEGTIEWEFVIAPVGYRAMGPVAPVNAPAGDWGPRRFRVRFQVQDALYSSIDLTADQLELVQAQPATPVRSDVVLTAAETDGIQNALTSLDLQSRALVAGFQVVATPLDVMSLTVKLVEALGARLTEQLLDRLEVSDHDDASFTRHGYKVYTFRRVITAWGLEIH